MNRALFLLPSAVLAVPAAAQIPVTVSGRVVAAPAGPCNPAATHAIECTDLLLRSTVVDLSRHAGSSVQVQGTLDVALGCLTVEVTAVDTLAAVRLSSSSPSNYRIGTSMTLMSQAPIGSVMVHFFSGERGFVPLGPGVGSYLLDFRSTIQWEIQLGFNLPFPRLIRIPDNPAIIGCRPHFQFFAADLTNPAESRFSNSTCFEIRG